VSLGFREDSDGSLVLPISCNLDEIRARRLELEVGLGLLKSRVSSMRSATKSTDKSKIGSAEDTKSSHSKLKKDVHGATADGEKVSELKTKKVVNVESASPHLADAGIGDYHDSAKENQATRQKFEQALQEEKTIRMKTEVALNQKSDLVKELQQQLFEFHERKNSELDFRQSLTLARMKLEGHSTKQEHNYMESHEKHVKAEAAHAKKDSSSKTQPDSKDMGNGSSCHSILKKAVKAGDTRITVNNQESFKKGMLILIGTGTKLEVRSFVSTGSIIINLPLESDHSDGELVLGFLNNPKGIQSMEKYIGKEFCRGLLLEEIVPWAVEIGEKNKNLKSLDHVYSNRPVLKSIYFAEAKGDISFPNTKFTAASLSVVDSSLYTSNNGVFGKIYMDVTPVDLINIFEDSNNEPVLNEASSAVQKRTFLITAEANPVVCGALKFVASHLNYDSLESLVFSLNQESEELSWSSFCEVFSLYGNTREAFRRPEGTDRLSKKDVEFLFRLFCMYDSDCDETLSRRGKYDALKFIFS
jgi:hypothetical protein